MCHSSQLQPKSSRMDWNGSSSSSFKRRCVSMSSMTDLPVCPIVSGVDVLQGKRSAPWKDDIVEVLPRVDLHLEQSDHVLAKHSCLVCGFLQWTRPHNSSSNSSSSKPLTSFMPGLFSVLRRSTQPAHLVVMVTVMLLAILLVPRQPILTNDSQNSILWPLVYLCSFSCLFGAQMWMTFVSGLVLLFVLPRHTFARVQSALFPKYMLLNSIAAIATLTSFVQMHTRTGVWNSQENYQMLSLLICCLAPLVARLYVVPGLLEQIAAKVALERAAGHGAEAGPKLDALTTHSLNGCLVYRHVCRSFRRRHMLVALVNMAVLGCNVLHIYYLSSKISFL